MEEENQPENRGDFDVSVNRWKCQKCKDTGIVKEADGSCHTCFDCLIEGRLDQHTDKLPSSKIKL